MVKDYLVFCGTCYSKVFLSRYEKEGWVSFNAKPCCPECQETEILKQLKKGVK